MKNNIYYIFGSGPTINDITDEEWEFLKNKNTISFACFPYSRKRTEYYFSLEDELIDKCMLTIIANSGYTDTKLLLHKEPSILHALHLGFRYIIKIYKKNALFYPSRKPWFTDELIPPHKFKDCRAHKFNAYLFRFRGQLSAVINSALILGATEIRLIGIDLNCQKNFFETEYQEGPNLRWINDELSTKIYNTLNLKSKEFFKNKLETNMFKDYDIKTMHSTNIPYVDVKRWGDRKLQTMEKVIEWENNELIGEGLNGIFVSSKKSKLYTDKLLSYKSIMDN